VRTYQLGNRYLRLRFTQRLRVRTLLKGRCCSRLSTTYDSIDAIHKARKLGRCPSNELISHTFTPQARQVVAVAKERRAAIQSRTLGFSAEDRHWIEKPERRVALSQRKYCLSELPLGDKLGLERELAERPCRHQRSSET
jgi:hypothetical protein